MEHDLVEAYQFEQTNQVEPFQRSQELVRIESRRVEKAIPVRDSKHPPVVTVEPDVACYSGKHNAIDG
jgi:hypothetical protein